MDKFLKKRNVIGYSNNKDDVQVFVTKKYDKATAQRLISNQKVDFWERDLVPKFVRNWFGKKKNTKVVEVGVVKAQEVIINNDRKRYRPLKGGCEIGIDGDRYVGTAGGVVYRRSVRNLGLFGQWDSFYYLAKKWGLPVVTESFILTNCHVAQKDVSNPKQWVYRQPLSGSVISRENETQPIFKDKDNHIDAALLKPSEGISLVPVQIPGWKIKGFRTKVYASDSLKKYGRTTSETHGKLINSGVTITVAYRGGSARFRNVYMVSDMSAGGDSGSMVLNQNDEVIGLIFAGGGNYSYIIPIAPIIDKFKLSTIYD